MYTGDYDDAQIPRWASERCIVSPPCSETPTIEDKEGLYGPSEVQTESSDGQIPAGEEEWSKKISRSGEEGSTKASLLRTEVNALVYACGDKFGIRCLKAAATEKFARSIAEEYKSKHFQEAIELVFRVTAPGDSEIRSELLLWYIRHREAVTGNLAKTMVEHEPLTWKVYLEMGRVLDVQKEGIATHKANLDARNAEIKEKDAKIRSVREDLGARLETAKGDNLQLHQTVDSFLDTYSSIEFCKSCGMEFGRIKVHRQKVWGTRFEIYCTCPKCGKRQ